MDNAIASTPALGLAVRDEWLFDWRWLFVNHGSFGGTPRIVLAAQDEWRQRLEEQPNRFMRRLLPERLSHATARVAAFVGADARDIVLIENTTVGCNAILRSVRFERGDEILVLSHGYDAVLNAVRYVAEQSDARVVEAVVPFPRPDDEAVIASISGALTPRTRVAVIDHITSSTALILPIRRLVEVCRSAGALVLVDGAHVPGQIELDLPSIGADWYVGNCHKWLMAPKGSAFLWARRDLQQELHPVTISHGLGQGFHAEFDWTGTRDPSAFLAIDAAIDFHYRLGGAALRSRNIGLAAEAGALIATRLGTECGGTTDQSAAMALVRLPLSGPATGERALALQERLLDTFKADAPVYAHHAAIWMRVSAHAYNELTDYEKLAEIAVRLVQDEN